MNQSDTTSETEVEVSRSKVILSRLGWTLLGLLFLIIFTVFKLPEDKIQNTINNNLSAALSTQGISYSAKKTYYSLIFGPTYTLEDVTFSRTSAGSSSPSTGHLDKVKFSPGVLSLLIGKMSGYFQLSEGKGEIEGRFSIKGNQFSVSYEASDFNLRKSGLIQVGANFQAGGIIEGKGSLKGDSQVPNTWDGDLRFKMSQGEIDPQLIYGFSIPKIVLSETLVDVNFQGGKATVKQVKVGKPGSSDDLQGSLSGSLVLGKSWDSSTLNLTARFSVSENVLRSFVLLDALLKSGKQPDGSYAFSLTGPVNAPMPMPLPANK